MKELTEAQQRVVDSTEESIAVVAAAGSGKTTVLIRRCLALIGDDPAQLERILAITFTEKAAAELKTRLRQNLPPRAHHRLTTSWIGTFHACCARMLRQHAPLIGLDPAFTILDENASDLIMRGAVHGTILAALERRDPRAVTLVDALDFKNATRVLEDLMAFRWHARRALADPVSDDEAEWELLRAAAHMYRLCEQAYGEELAIIGALDFQDLEIRALLLLERHPDVLASYQKRFTHLLIDEFQDTNDVQMEFVNKLFAPGTNTLCIVGDPRQSIYRFRGANVDCFGDALKRIRSAGGNAVPLTHNFRSRSGLIGFINDASERLSEGLFGTHPDDEVLTPAAEAMQATRSDEGPGPSVVMLDLVAADAMTASQRRRYEAASIAAYVERVVAAGSYELGDIVCLFQALTDVGDYEAAFKARGIPYRFFGGRGLLDRQEVCDLMQALRYAANPGNDVALLGLLRSPLIGISDEECVRLAGPDGKGLRGNARAHPACRLLVSLESAAHYRRPSEILKAVIDETGYEWIVSELDASGGMRASIDRLVLLAQSLEHQAPTSLADFISFVTHLRERSARLGDPPAAGDAAAAVRCMTVHTAKGLEFPVVILPDLFRQEPTSGRPWIFHRQEGCAFKLKDPEQPFGQRIATPRYEQIAATEKFQAEAERARLLYVAMTRARDSLVLPIHRAEKIKGRWHEWLKPLARGITASVTYDIDILRDAAAKGDENERPSIENFDRTAAIAHVRTKTRTFSVSQLEAFDRCPQEYHLKYVLGLPAANVLQEESAGIAANVRGSIAHSVLEKLRPQHTNKLDALIRDECFAHDVYPDDAAITEIAKSLRAFMKTPLFNDASEGVRETRFDWAVAGNIVTGYIDWYRETPKGPEVIDFKTDHVDAAGVSLRTHEYDLQMITYALALEHALRVKAAATTLVFLTPAITRSIPVDEARRQAGMQRIQAIMEHIALDNFALEDIAPPCYKCPYHHNGMCWKDKLIDHDR